MAALDWLNNNEKSTPCLVAVTERIIIHHKWAYYVSKIDKETNNLYKGQTKNILQPTRANDKQHDR